MRIGKENFLTLLAHVPDKAVNEAIFAVVDDRIIISGRTTAFQSVYKLDFPILDDRGYTEPFALSLDGLSKIRRIEDDTFLINPGKITTITGSSNKQRVYQFGTLDISSCLSYLNYKRSETVSIKLTEGRYERTVLEDPSRDKVVLFDKEVVLCEATKQKLLIEAVSDCSIMLDFRPDMSSLYVEDIRDRTFTRFDFPTAIAFEYELVVGSYFMYVLKLLQGDVSLMLSDSGEHQLIGSGGIFLLGKLRYGVDDFIQRVRNYETVE